MSKLDQKSGEMSTEVYNSRLSSNLRSICLLVEMLSGDWGICLTSLPCSSPQVRHNVRPLFQGTVTHRLVYDIITWAGTQIAICYTVVPFVLLAVGPSLKFYR